MKSIKNYERGKNNNMENKIREHEEILNLVRENIKEDIAEKNTYTYKVKGRKVKVVFSDNPSAPTIENALVKIVSRRIS